MSRNQNVQRAWDRARQARARLAPVAARVKPLAGKTGEVAKRQVRKTRAWAAPQVKRTGQVLQENVAPKVSAMMSSAADRIDPDRPRRGRGRKGAGTAAVTATTRAAAVLRKRVRRGPAASANQHDATQPAETPNEQPSAGDGADTDADTDANATIRAS